jgi:hypothetical protein
MKNSFLLLTLFTLFASTLLSQNKFFEGVVVYQGITEKIVSQSTVFYYDQGIFFNGFVLNNDSIQVRNRILKIDCPRVILKSFDGFGEETSTVIKDSEDDNSYHFSVDREEMIPILGYSCFKTKIVIDEEDQKSTFEYYCASDIPIFKMGCDFNSAEFLYSSFLTHLPLKIDVTLETKPNFAFGASKVELHFNAVSFHEKEIKSYDQLLEAYGIKMEED